VTELHNAIFIVLKKVALLGGALERIGREAAKATPSMADFEHSMKQFEGEFLILQAFIHQVSAQWAGDRAFDAWLDQVRDAAHEVEDTIDEYAYLTAQAMDTSSFCRPKFEYIRWDGRSAGLTLKRKFHNIKTIAAWQKSPNRISQEKQDQSLIAILGMGGLGKTTIASSVYKNQKILTSFDCHAWVDLLYPRLNKSRNC
ncbi:hypothetical protein U9M48_026364, partial [Paspalum notatum var. saurae]